jgi:hypothetical protein
MSETGNAQPDAFQPPPPPLTGGSIDIERRGLRFGDLLGTGFSLLFSRFFIIPLALVVMLPTLVCHIYLPTSRIGIGVNWWNILAATFVYVLCQSVLSSVLIYAVVKKLQGQNVGLGTAIARGLGATLRSFVTSFLMTLIAIVGFALLVIPGWIWQSMLWVAVPVTVVERDGPLESLERSATLTKGYRWTIFGVFFVLGLLEYIVALALGAALRVLSHSAAEILRNFLIAQYVLQAFEAALLAVMISYSYYRLVEAKEGTNIDKIASVFE